MESTHTCDHTKENHSHEHNHSHGKSPVVLFFVGLVLFIIGLFLPKETLIQNGVFLAAMLLSGYHIILEGVEDTIKESKEKENLCQMFISS